MECVDYKKNLDECFMNKVKYSSGYFALMPVYGKKFVLDWCMNEGLMASSYECSKCGKQMNLTKQPKLNDGYEWKCRSRSKVNPYDCSRSVRKGSWFAGSHLSDFCREVCQTVLIEERTMIGGVGSTVEIDESKFGKMKYGRGRTSEELVSVLKEWVLPGTEVISDCWKAYDCLKDEGFTHLQVQHNLHFKDPETGAHTNTIEGT
ncbi:hypothetical protein HNY73_021251 [Argiope bruennichi]|uniref:ISXO2-like transposase domain-containing protein n=1 Tax=Argiope bruennichi TaxID=94029 RepID=A0A8T0EAD2_ARGBR|nr:hypothetical protein HNY73_021251 [Argiope bruennichi]